MRSYSFLYDDEGNKNGIMCQDMPAYLFILVRIVDFIIPYIPISIYSWYKNKVEEPIFRYVYAHRKSKIFAIDLNKSQVKNIYKQLNK